MQAGVASRGRSLTVQCIYHSCACLGASMVSQNSSVQVSKATYSWKQAALLLLLAL